MKKPDRLPLLEESTIRFVLETQGRGTADDRLRDLPGRTLRRELMVGESASAELTVLGGRATVSPKGPLVKDVTDYENVEWSWAVTPTRPGRLVLEVTVHSIVNVNGRQIKLSPRAFSERVPIQVTFVSGLRYALAETRAWIEQVNPIWTWLCAFVAAIGSALVWLRNFRRNSRPKAAEPAAVPEFAPPPLRVAS